METNVTTSYSIRSAVLALVLAGLLSGRQCYADLNQRYICTIEWLVFHSDHIVVAEFDADSAGKPTRINQVLKGNAREIEWPLEPAEIQGYGQLKPISDGRFRLIFVENESTLLQSVRLDRNQQVDTPSILDVLYGVDGDGNLLLSQAELFRCIHERIAKQYSPFLKLRKPSHGGTFPLFPGHDRRSDVWAPRQFPLSSNGECYTLLVVFTQDRRDRLVHLLETGNASQRMDAIDGLAQHADRESREAIRDAANASFAEPSYQRDGSGKMVCVGTEEVTSYATRFTTILFGGG